MYRSSCCSFVFSTWLSLEWICHASRPKLCRTSTLLIGIDVPHYEAVVTTDLSTESGTILLNGLPKDAPLCFSAYLPARMDPTMLSHHHLRLSSLPA